jgi:MATE family multidrug resistance protein
VGKEFGARKRCIENGSDDTDTLEAKGDEAIRRVVRLLFAWSLGMGVLFTLIFYVWEDPLYRLMTSDRIVLGRLADYTFWLVTMPIVSTLAFMWDGVYAGATAGKQIRNAMIYAALGFVLCYVATYWWLGIQGLYIAYFVHLLARVLYLTFAWRKVC